MIFFSYFLVNNYSIMLSICININIFQFFCPLFSVKAPMGMFFTLTEFAEVGYNEEAIDIAKQSARQTG